MMRYSLVIALAGLLAGFLATATYSARLPEDLRQRLMANNFNVLSAPVHAGDMDLRTIEGAPVKLSSLRGKVVLLNFWKIDCPPCSLEKPILERIHRKFASKGLEIVAVNLFDDEKQIRSYVNKARLSFTIAHDPDNRQSVRRQILESGIPTSFVVNSDMEAIYELPGVPTTYVINRQGQVAGMSVGMVDWEQRPFVDFIETILGTASSSRTASTQTFAEPAGQGPTASGRGPRIGPRQSESGGPAPADETAESVAGPSGTTSDRAQTPSALPFGPPAAPPEAAQSPVPAAVPQAPSLGADVVPPDTNPDATRKKARAKKKPEPGQTARRVPRQTKPRQYIPDTWGGGAAVPAPPVAGQPSPGASSMPPPSAPAGASPAAAGQPSASLLPPLPPAIPYTPPRLTGRRPPEIVRPDEHGEVAARIPSAPPQVQGSAQPWTAPQVTPILPPGAAAGQANPIDDFILDSFQSQRMRDPMPAAPRPPAPRPPASTSVLDQVGKDFKDLGQGIKDIFSKIAPRQ